MKSAAVSQEFAAKFATEKETPYTRWVRDEGLDIISSFYVENLHTVALKPWLPVTIRRSLCEKAADQIGPRCCRSCLRGSLSMPLSTSQTLATLSPPPLTTRRLSREKATGYTRAP